MGRREGVRLHTHLCETLDEERYTLQRWGMRPVEYMRSVDWAGDDVWYAHAIHVNDAEIREFARAGIGACHCPCSNMRLASGIAPVMKYRRAGVKVGIGVDGSASNDGNHMLGEVRQAMLLARLQIGLRPPEGPDTTLSTSDPSGALAVGKQCDFFALDLNSLAYAGALADPVAATLFCAPQTARHTVVAGRPVVRDGRIVTIDLERTVAEHNRHAARLASLV
jgi:cytosine/adenosine deaminase-related metal-dependent hydrolase